MALTDLLPAVERLIARVELLFVMTRRLSRDTARLSQRVDTCVHFLAQRQMEKGRAATLEEALQQLEAAVGAHVATSTARDSRPHRGNA